MCLVAVLSGATSPAKIVRIAGGSDPKPTRRLGPPGQVPAATTLGRLPSRIDGDAFDDAIGAYLAALTRDPVEGAWSVLSCCGGRPAAPRTVHPLPCPTGARG